MVVSAGGLSQSFYESPSGVIQYCDVGTGLPVIYFHGTGAGNEAAVLLEQELLSAGCRLIVPNRPGYFQTSLGLRGSAEYCAKLAVELLDYLVLARAAVIGTSGGGMPAAAFARAYPDRTAALVLQCAQSHRWDEGRWLPKGIERSLPLFRRPASYAFLGWYNRLHAWRMKRDPELCLRQMCGSRFSDVKTEKCLAATIERLVGMTFNCAAQPRGIKNDWAILVADNGVRSAKNDCPTLIIHDREDPLVPFIHAEWSHTAIADSELFEISGSGHLIWFGPDAKRMNQKRMEFLKRHLPYFA